LYKEVVKLIKGDKPKDGNPFRNTKDDKEFNFPEKYDPKNRITFSVEEDKELFID
jgi:hypothetical protein